MSDQNGAGDQTLDLPRSERPGGTIGPFKILQQLGEGGFGSVFEAEQEHPVKRRVALKVIKLGMDTREVIARFEAERQALALMDHPHIARVLDAGATDSGRPYFVMELVKGEPISKYCKKHDLPIVQRLVLFEQVCEAVQHAHTKGIIHRDLKPSNVLVSTHDDRPFAKVIDFGIAKATSGRLTDKTLFTEANLMMGTPAYMSPEQAEGSADIDTRTDIYSLGVILYELLTDTTPLDSNTLHSAGYAEVQRIIREVEPPRPSARLSQSAKLSIGEGGKRFNDPRKLAGQVRGELDWIAMKAIEKDRTRRYETANGLAMDVRRYLAGEAVLAAPPSASYRLRKFVRRNKGTVAAGSLIAASLLAGIAGFAWQAHIAQKRAAELEQVSKFQADMLDQVDPTRAGKLLSEDVHAKFAAFLVRSGVPAGERAARIASFAADWQGINATDTASDLIDHTILKPAVAAIDKQFKNQPLVDASLRQGIVDVYANLGLYDNALTQQRRALAIRRRELGEDHPDTLDSIAAMGILLTWQDKFSLAEPYTREALVKRRRVLGVGNRQTLESMDKLVFLLQEEGKYAEAEPYAREAVEVSRRVLGPDDEQTLESLNRLGAILMNSNKSSEAERYARQAMEGYHRARGNDDSGTYIAASILSGILRSEGKNSEAEAMIREALDGERRVLGEENPETLRTMEHLGSLLTAESKLGDAESTLRDALDKSRLVLGPLDGDTLIATWLLGECLVAQHRYADADQLLAPAEPAFRSVFGADDPPRTSSFLRALGDARSGLGKFPAAQSDLLEALAIIGKAYGPAGVRARKNIQSLVDLYTAWNAAEPGKGYDAKAAEWKTKLEAIKAASPAPTRS